MVSTVQNISSNTNRTYCLTYCLTYCPTCCPTPRATYTRMQPQVFDIAHCPITTFSFVAIQTYKNIVHLPKLSVSLLLSLLLIIPLHSDVSHNYHIIYPATLQSNFTIHLSVYTYPITNSFTLYYPSRIIPVSIP